MLSKNRSASLDCITCEKAYGPAAYWDCSLGLGVALLVIFLNIIDISDNVIN